MYKMTKTFQNSKNIKCLKEKKLYKNKMTTKNLLNEIISTKKYKKSGSGLLKQLSEKYLQKAKKLRFSGTDILKSIKRQRYLHYK